MMFLSNDHVLSCMLLLLARCKESCLRVGKHYLDGLEPDDGKALFFLGAAAKVCTPLEIASAEAIRRKMLEKMPG